MDKYLDPIIFYFSGQFHEETIPSNIIPPSILTDLYAYFSPLKEKWEEYWETKPLQRPELLRLYIRFDYFVEFYSLENVHRFISDSDAVYALYIILKDFAFVQKRIKGKDTFRKGKDYSTLIQEKIPVFKNEQIKFFNLMDSYISSDLPLEIKSSALQTFESHPMKEFTDRLISYCKTLPDFKHSERISYTLNECYDPHLEILEGYGANNWFWLYDRTEEPQVNNRKNYQSLPYLILDNSDERGLPLYLDLWKRGIIGNLMEFEPENEEGLERIFQEFINRGMKVEILLEALEDWPDVRDTFIRLLREMHLPDGFDEIILKERKE